MGVKSALLLVRLSARIVLTDMPKQRKLHRTVSPAEVGKLFSRRVANRYR